MSVRLIDVTLSAAAIQALVANHYYWIDRNGGLVDVGGAVLVATVAVPIPSDLAAIDVSMWQAVELYVSHGVLTGGVGGKVSVAELATPQDLAPPAGSPIVAGGATIDQALAATAESVVAGIINPPTLRRQGKVALAILWTTVPTVAAPTRIQVIGHRDGLQPQRG